MLWLATSVLATWLAEPRLSVVPPPVLPAGAVAASSDATTCDDGTWAGSLVQNENAAYGNRFLLTCTSARLQQVSFIYDGAGWPGPYNFRVRVLDADCNTLATSDVLVAADAAAAPATMIVDLESLALCVQSGFAVAIEPLTCPVAEDCFPAVAVDATSDGNPEAHCAVVAVLGGAEPECLAPRSTDGRYFDFCLRATVDCQHPACATAVRVQTWSHIKRLYSDPGPGSSRSAPASR